MHQRGLKGGGFNAEEVAARAGFTNVQAWLRAWRSKHGTDSMDRRAAAAAALALTVYDGGRTRQCGGFGGRSWRASSRPMRPS